MTTFRRFQAELSLAPRCHHSFNSRHVKAFQILRHGQPGTFRLTELPEPTPGEDEVVVEVKACGLNHLDLWVEEGSLPVPITLPRIPGGEISGVILEVGSRITEWKAGDCVALQSNLFCGKCEYCLKGEESICLKGELLGVHRDGGFAEKVVVPSRALVRLPETVAFHSSAALTLAGSTAMHMLTNRTQVIPGEWVLAMGASSGVGSAAIQIAAQLGAQVISTASTPEKRALALKLGAVEVVDLAQPDWPAEIRRLTRRHGVDLVIEHIGGEIFVQLFGCLARGGRIVTCGATAGREVALNLWPLFVKQQQIIGSYGRTRQDIVSTLQWVDEGKLKPVIDRVIPLDEAASAFARLRSRKVLGKLLVVPHPG